MKITNEVKEVNVGVQVELSNVELTVLATEVDKVVKSSPTLHTIIKTDEHLTKESTVRVDAVSLINILTFIGKFTKGTVSLEDAQDALFTKEVDAAPFDDNYVENLVEASIGLSKGGRSNESI